MTTMQPVIADRAKLGAFAAAQHGFASAVNAGAFKAALPNVCAKLMATAGITKANVRITFQGTRAFASYSPIYDDSNSKVVNATLNLPALDAQRTMTRNEANRWLGYGLHEMLHVILTPKQEWDQYCASHTPFQRILLNAVEDPRIEHAGMKRGICAGFANVGTALLAHLLATTPADFNPNTPGGFPFAIAVILRDYGGEGQRAVEAKLHPKMRAIVDEAIRMYRAVDPLTSVIGDSIRIAERLSDLLRDMAMEQPEQPKQKQPKQKQPKQEQEQTEPSDDDAEGEAGDAGDDADDEGEDDAQGSGDGDEGEGEGEGEGDDAQGSGDGDEGDDDAEDDAQGGGGEGDDAEGDDAQGDAEGESDAEGEDEGEGESQSGGGTPHDSGNRPESKPDDLKAFANTDALNEDEIVPVEPTLEADKPVQSDGTADIGECSLDTHAFYETDESGHLAGKVMQAARVAGVRSQLRRLLQRTDYMGETRGLRRGKLVQSALARTAIGDTNVFCRRWEQEGEDVAVSIVIDMSSSMNTKATKDDAIYSNAEQSRIGVATKTALIIAESLSATNGVKVEVLGFPGSRRAMSDATNGGVGMGWGGNTWEMYKAAGADVQVLPGITLMAIKSFGERINVMRRRILSVMTSASGGTPDLNALDGAAKRLIAQPAGKRILFMICDGDGADLTMFRNHVDMLYKKHGVLCIGLGIGCGSTFADRFRYGAVVANVKRLAEDCLTTLINAIEKDRA